MMKCEKFRKDISRPESHSKEAELHLENCPHCQAWIEKEIATPPEGLSSAEWQTATARCFPETHQVKDSDSYHEEPKSFWNFFADGLKFGVVFGLSIVTGFAILSIRSEQSIQFDLEKPHKLSFYSPDEKKLPDFIEKEKFDVTFFNFSDSKLVSFVEEAEMSRFYNETEENES